MILIEIEISCRNIERHTFILQFAVKAYLPCIACVLPAMCFHITAVFIFLHHEIHDMGFSLKTRVGGEIVIFDFLNILHSHALQILFGCRQEIYKDINALAGQIGYVIIC